MSSISTKLKSKLNSLSESVTVRDLEKAGPKLIHDELWWDWFIDDDDELLRLTELLQKEMYQVRKSIPAIQDNWFVFATENPVVGGEFSRVRLKFQTEPQGDLLWVAEWDYQDGKLGLLKTFKVGK